MFRIAVYQVRYYLAYSWYLPKLLILLILLTFVNVCLDIATFFYLTCIHLLIHPWTLLVVLLFWWRGKVFLNCKLFERNFKYNLLWFNFPFVFLLPYLFWKSIILGTHFRNFNKLVTRKAFVLLVRVILSNVLNI